MLYSHVSRSISSTAKGTVVVPVNFGIGFSLSFKCQTVSFVGCKENPPEQWRCPAEQASCIRRDSPCIVPGALNPWASFFLALGHKHLHLIFGKAHQVCGNGL